MLINFVRRRVGWRGDRGDDQDDRLEIVDDQDGEELEKKTAYATADCCPMCGAEYDEYLTHLNRDCDPD